MGGCPGVAAEEEGDVDEENWPHTPWQKHFRMVPRASKVAPPAQDCGVPRAVSSRTLKQGWVQASVCSRPCGGGSNDK